MIVIQPPPPQPAPCINPPIFARGWLPFASFKFWKGNFSIPGAASAVDDAFTNWRDANQASGLSTYFSPWTTGSVDIYVAQDPNIIFPEVGGVSYYRTDAQGYVTGGTMAFADPSTNGFLTSAAGVLKVILHEVGHMSGLDHANGSNGSSVMNNFNGANDSGGNLPTAVTPCDQNQAWAASF